MTRLRAWADWPERALRRGLALLESQLALIALCLVIGAIAAAIAWWDSSDTIRNFALIVAGAAGFPLVIWRSRVADRQAATAEKALLDTRFDRAVQMIESTLPTVRDAARMRIAEIGRRYHQDYGKEAMLLLDDEFDVEEMADDDR